jgi:hypothetical protein
MEKEFVPYELALRMKQLGFNERCFKYEDAKKICENNARPGGCQLPNVHCGYPNCTIDRNVEPLAIPIWQQAFRWFREKYKLNQLVTRLPKHYVGVIDSEDGIIQLFYQRHDTYEEAEAACLTKLIEIVEQNNKQ